MPVAADWRMLGRKLGLEEYQLKIIECENLAVAEKLVAALDEWLRKKPDASWADVIRALEIMRENTLVEKIRKKYTPAGMSMH